VDEEPPARNRRKLFLILGVIAAALALVAAYLVFGRGGEPVQMPSVVGMNQSEAEQTLESLGLKVDVEIEDVPKEKADTVIEQSEEEGTTVETGSTVSLTVASGFVSLPVDEIIGSSYREARSMLEELGLTADRITRASGSQAGLVLDIQETSDRVEVGSTVTLVVAIAKKATPDPEFTPTPSPTPKPKPTKTTKPPPNTDADGTDTDGTDTDGTDTDGADTDGENPDGG
jgi:serine/threonine-protein kinase